MSLSLALALSAVLQVPAGPPSRKLPVPERRPNIVLIVADDLGVDMIGCYGEGTDTPCTPVIDSLAADGVLFRNAWTNPTCSPTRAQILTGRHGFRTGIGSVVTPPNVGLSLDETLLPEVLTGYASAALGKWHLADRTQGIDHPVSSGFAHFAGTMGNTSDYPWTIPDCGGPFDYYNWVKVDEGGEHCTSGYVTSDTADDAIASAQSMPEPWFLYVAFNAAHSPVQAPPAQLCGVSGPSCFCPVAPGDDLLLQARAVVEALDTEIGRMLEGIYAVDPDAIVIFIGDNGTARGVSTLVGGCFDPVRSKGTLYEGGVNVPLIFNGPDFVPGEVDALVSSTDLFATIGRLALVPAHAEDSVSMVPYLMGDRTPQRETVYAEFFFPNTVPPPTFIFRRTIRNQRFKLIRRTEGGATADELFDLLVDPCELTNLHPTTPGTLAAENYALLEAQLEAFGVN